MTDLTVRYEGPSLDEHTIDVRTLAPALLALADVFKEVHQIADPGSPEVGLKIKATSPGSFEIDLQLWSDAVVGLLATDAATGMANLKALVVDPARGLFEWLRRGGRTSAVEVDPVTGDVTYESADGTTFKVPAEVVTAGNSVTVKRSVREIVQPLRSGGIDSVSFASDFSEVMTITTEDLPALDAATTDAIAPAVVDDQTAEMTLKVLSPVFEGRSPWRFRHEDSEFSATIEDKAFWRSVDLGEAFRSGDTIDALVRFQTTRQNGKPPKVKWTVVEVRNHTSATVEPAPPEMFGPSLEPLDHDVPD